MPDPNAEYAGTRMGRWLRGWVKVRRMLLVGSMCLIVSLNTWIPREIRGLLFLGGAVLLTWNLVLEFWPRKRRKVPPNGRSEP
jgi:hypothetical protein